MPEGGKALVIRQLVFSNEADKEFHSAVAWYQAQQPGLGRRFIGSVDRTLIKIVENPLLFPKNNRGIHRAGTHRFPYGIFYRVNAHSIVVVGVRHDRQRPKTWKES